MLGACDGCICWVHVMGVMCDAAACAGCDFLPSVMAVVTCCVLLQFFYVFCAISVATTTAGMACVGGWPACSLTSGFATLALSHSPSPHRLAHVAHDLSDAQIRSVAAAAHGCVGADLAALVDAAALQALRRCVCVLDIG